MADDYINLAGTFTQQGRAIHFVGTLLRASYFAAEKPGPGVLLFAVPSSNRTRKEWDDVAGQLAASGMRAEDHQEVVRDTINSYMS